MSIKSLIIVPVIALFFAAAIQVSASTQNPNQNGRKDNDSLEAVTVTPAQESDDDCEDENLKNHGAYVSCIARKHEGGESVSAAARSSIGKKDEKDDEDENTFSVTPTVIPTVAVTASPTVSPSVTPVSSTTQVESAIAAQLKSLIEELQNLINFLTSLAHD